LLLQFIGTSIMYIAIVNVIEESSVIETTTIKPLKDAFVITSREWLYTINTNNSTRAENTALERTCDKLNVDYYDLFKEEGNGNTVYYSGDERYELTVTSLLQEFEGATHNCEKIQDLNLRFF
jgi:beta-lactamase class A